MSTRVVGAAELAPFLGADYDLDADFVAEATARGDRCVANFLGDELVGYAWIAYGPTPHLDGVWCETGSPDRYAYKAFTHPRFRGKRLRGTFHALEADDAAFGVTHSVSFIAWWNRSSMKAIARNQAVRIGWAGYWTIGTRRFCFRSPGARRAGFRFFVPRE
ncbi:MAG: hypothetical protein AAF648_07785 [Pseudomonadota bacterium]